MSKMKKEDLVFILVLVRPKAQRDEITAWEEGMMRIRVKALPVKGEANDGCRRLLSDVLGMPVSRVTIQKGKSAHVKKALIRGVSKYDVEQIRQRWLLRQMNSIGHKRYNRSKG